VLVMYLGERKRKYLLGYAFFGFTTMAISLSRAALGAGVLILGFILVVAFRRDLLNRKICLNIAAATLAATLLVGPFVLAHYTERFSTVDVSDYTEDPNTLTRAVQTVSAINEIGKHPIFGGGAASFQLAFDWETFGEGWGDIGWIGNTELRVLHDTGVAGFFTFIIFLIYLAWLARKVLKRESSPELIALLAGGVVYCITFQATEGTLLAFTWVHLGLIGCGVAIMSRGQEHADEARRIAAS